MLRFEYPVPLKAGLARRLAMARLDHVEAYAGAHGLQVTGRPDDEDAAEPVLIVPPGRALRVFADLIAGRMEPARVCRCDMSRDAFIPGEDEIRLRAAHIGALVC